MSTGVGIFRSIAGAAAALKAEILGLFSASDGSSLIGHIASGAGTASETLQAYLRKGAVYASSFAGFDVTGATDSSAAVVAAIASLPTGGGVVYIPRGTPRFNVSILKSGVTLRGPGMSQDRAWSAASNYVRPWNDAQPCIQVGNDTGLVVGVSIEEMTVYGAGTGTIGIYFAGGAFRCTTRNVSSYEFTANNWKFKGGAANPCSLIFNYGAISQSTVAGNDGVLIDGNVATYTSAVYFIGSHMSVNGVGSHALAVDSCDSVFMSNTYIDADDLKGVVLRKTGARSPIIYADNFTIDSANNANVLLEVYNASLRPSEFIRGGYSLDGKIKNNAAATAGPFTGPDHQLFTPLLRGPLVDGPMSFPDPTTDPNWYSDTSANIAPSGAAGARKLTVSGAGGVDVIGTTLVRLGANGGYRWSVADFALLPTVDNTTNLGDSGARIKFAYINQLRPGVGATAPVWTSGAGSPEGVLAASIGSLYTRTDGGAGTVLYVKESGGGNTGWVAK